MIREDAARLAGDGVEHVGGKSWPKRMLRHLHSRLLGDAFDTLESRYSMNRRIVFILGLLAPFVFIFTVILGGALRPGYSHITDTMSELFSPGSPNRLLLSALYTFFAASLTVYGFGLLHFVQNHGNFLQIGTFAAIAYIAVGVINILTATIFPQDAWGSTPTLFGRLHIILHGGISLLSVLYIVLFGVWFHRTGIAKPFLVYSLVTVIAAAVSTIWLIASYGSPLMGLSERVAALIGFQWTISLSVVILKND